MSEVQPGEKKPDLLRWAIVSFAVVGVAAVLYVIASASFKPKESAGLNDLRTGELAKLEVPAAPRAAPTVAFQDADGKSATIADFKGKVTVVNLWATWCAPCKIEMPTLAALQAAYQTQPVAVVPVSVDKDVDLNLAQAFIAKNPPLKLYRDPQYALAFGLEPKAAGFPTTIVYDKQGRERARLAGDADWNGKEARALVERLLAE
ncbi:MAG TPA: TlpA disulfide reductase family protein [Caulobacter sp.]|nr:TlpA disulfide reductase family protein [Caulobacter sp.]